MGEKGGKSKWRRQPSYSWFFFYEYFQSPAKCFQTTWIFSKNFSIFFSIEDIQPSEAFRICVLYFDKRGEFPSARGYVLRTNRGRQWRLVTFKSRTDYGDDDDNAETIAFVRVILRGGWWVRKANRSKRECMRAHIHCEYNPVPDLRLLIIIVDPIIQRPGSKTGEEVHYIYIYR